MPAGQLTPLVHYIRRFRGAAGHAESCDRQLLDLFARRGDEAAFTELVRRHGPMVLGVCRRVLRDAHEAEDAFQATFLLLVRKAGSLRQPEALGPWLHGVAYRTAVRARSHAVRRRAGQGRVEDLPAPAAEDLLWRDLREVLDEAISTLPAKYRAPFVLCYLEGMTNAQAALHLGCPSGTVATRLSRARQRLRAQLTKRGLALATGLPAMALVPNTAPAVPPALLARTVRAGMASLAGRVALTCVVPAPVVALTQEVWRSMMLNKVRMLLAVLVAVGLAGAGTGLMTYRAPAGEPPPAKQPPAPWIGVVPPPAPPAAAPPAEEPAGPTSTHRTANFRVEARSPRIARLVAEAAERQRQSRAVLWLGEEMPPWPEPCPVKVTISRGGTGGATSFAFDKGRVLSQDMHLEGSLEQVLGTVLPHEVTHTVLAHHFRCPVPRWADEGAAVLSEDEEELVRYDKMMGQVLNTPGRLIPLRRLLPMQDFPRDVMVLFTEGYSLTRFLVGRRDRRTFLKFVQQGSREGWDEAVRAHYGYHDVEKLEDAWIADLRKKHGNEPHAAAAPTARGGEPSHTIGAAPITALAVLAGEGTIVLRRPTAAYVQTTRYVKTPGEDVVKPVTSYELVTVAATEQHPVARVVAYDTDGNAVAADRLARMLQKERPVLVAADGQKVNPFHLQLIKKGTLILVPPVNPPPADMPAAPAAPPVQQQGRAGNLGPAIRFAGAGQGPLPVALDFGFPVVKGEADNALRRSAEQAFNFWMGYFR